jgi:hypothetical protein
LTRERTSFIKVVWADEAAAVLQGVAGYLQLAEGSPLVLGYGNDSRQNVPFFRDFFTMRHPREQVTIRNAG